MEIRYILTEAQIKDICKCFGKENLEDWEVAELLDRIIDEYLCANN